MNTHLNCPGCGRLVDIPGLCKECFDDGVNNKFWDEKKKRFYTDKEIIKQRDETIKQLREALKMVLIIAENGMVTPTSWRRNLQEEAIYKAKALIELKQP